MTIYHWLSNNWIEIFGAVTGIIYVFLEIRQKIWLWPVGIVTSAVYILVFFTNKFYADMGLQVYYLVISVLGWYWWVKGAGRRTQGTGRRAQGTEREGEKMRKGEAENGRHYNNSPLEGGRALKNDPVDHFSEGARLQGKGDVKLKVSHLKLRTGLILSCIFVLLYFLMWFVLSRLTDSPVPEWDSFITSLSIVATWMLALKIYEHWFLWIAVNSVASLVFFSRGLYPTVVLYLVYLAMSFAGLKVWKRSL